MLALVALTAAALAGPLRDPFAPLGVFVDTPPPRLATQAWSAAEFRLVGVVQDGDAPAALVLDPAGRSHVLELDAYLGEEWGRVRHIGRDHVRVDAEFIDLHGDIAVTSTVLRLPGL
jgi:hypothetical protein